MADSIDIKESIPTEICGDCIKRKQQRKSSYKSMSQSSKYLEYLYYDLGKSYPTTQKDN